MCGLASGGVFCTGTLISNQSHVLTANHCVSTQSGANTTNLWFRYQELCGTGTLRGTHVVPAPQTFVVGQPSGPGADFTVLRANGTPLWYVVYTDAGHEEFTRATNDFNIYAWVLFVREYLVN